MDTINSCMQVARVAQMMRALGGALDVGGVLMENIREVEKPDDWVFEGLIERGDQCLIAGAPKAGKSLLASQIALAAASGNEFLRWRPVKKCRVVYVNLEIRAKRFAGRLLRQAGTSAEEVRHTRRVPPIIAEINSGGRLVPVHGFRTMDVLAGGSDVERLRAEIAMYMPDLVVIDVLARCHNEDEMTPTMRRVMHALRDLVGNAASIVVHHTRKPLTDEVRPQQASDIRGSSSIHGEVDLAMILSRRPGTGARYALTWSARNVEEPPELLLNVGRDLRFVDAEEQQATAARDAIMSAFLGRPALAAGDLLDAVRMALRCGRDAAYAAISEALDAGILVAERAGRARLYRLSGS